MPEREQKEFSFINEQLKKKPFYKKRWFQKGISAGALAILFGGTAGFTFSVVQPWAQKQFGKPEDPAQIIVVQEDTETESEAIQEETQEEEVPQTVIEEKELEIADYTMLYQKMADIADSVSASFVTVTCETNQLNWFNEVIENHVQDSGLIIAQSQEEYFILTGSPAVESSGRIIVTFPNGSSGDAVLQKRDFVTGLSVVCVPKTKIPRTGKTPVPAELCTMEKVSKGEPVIALGTPVGNNTSISFGMITSIERMSMVDSQYRALHTDILGSGQGSGILIDLNGKIIGIITQNVSKGNGQITLSALAASDIQGLATDLANNRESVSVGITGKEIDDMLSGNFDMPKGIYVRSVLEESPAMYAGVCVGDIITAINKTPVKKLEEYEEEIQKYHPDDLVRLSIKREALDGYADMEVSVQLGRR